MAHLQTFRSTVDEHAGRRRGTPRDETPLQSADNVPRTGLGDPADLLLRGAVSGLQ